MLTVECFETLLYCDVGLEGSERNGLEDGVEALQRWSLGHRRTGLVQEEDTDV